MHFIYTNILFYSIFLNHFFMPQCHSIACLRLRHHTTTDKALELHVEADIETCDNAFCEDYGLSIPDTFKMCGQ